MAAEYFLYTTLYNNTLVERSKTSFAPLPPDTGEIFIDYFIPTNQPLFYYRESGGTIVFNTEEEIVEYLNDTSLPPSPTDSVVQFQFTGYSASTNSKIDYISGVTDAYINNFNLYTGTTAPLTFVNVSGDNMTGSLSTTSNLIAAGAVTGSTICGGVWVHSPFICGENSVQSPIISGSSCIVTPILIGTSSVSSPVILGSTCLCTPTVCVSSCLCSIGTARFIGSISAASTLNVSGNTRLGSDLYLNSVSTGGTLNDYALTYDPITQVIRGIPQGSGGTANVYCYADCEVTQANSTTVNATYLTATWCLPAGRYEMEYNAIFGNDTSNRCAIICFLRDGVVVGACNLAKTNDTNARTTAYVTQDYIATGNTNHTVSIVHRQCGGGNSIINFGAIRYRKTGA
jgi:hypothetical protein